MIFADRYSRHSLLSVSRVAVAGVLALVAATAVACSKSGTTKARTSTGSSTLETSGAPMSTEEVASSSDAPTDAGTSADLHQSGTLVQSGNGTAISEAWSVGEPETATSGTAPADVPDDVLDACDTNNSGTIAMTAFIRAKVTIGYTEGTLPTSVAIANNELVNGGGFVGTVGLDVDGDWQCGAGAATTSLNFQAGEQVTYDAWILAEVISNSNPEVTPEQRNAWVFGGSGPIRAGGLPFVPVVKTTGAGALCPDRGILFVYATSASGVSC